MIVHAHVRELRRHDCKRPPAAYLEKLGLPGSIELQKGRADLKALGPFGPASISVRPVDRKHRGASGGIPAPLNRLDLPGGKVEQRFDAGLQAGRLQAVIDVHFEPP